MTRRLIIATLALCLTTHLTGCTSGSSKDDQSTAEANDQNFAEEGEGDFADDSNKTKAEEPPPPGDTPSDVAAAPTDKTADAGALPEDDLAIDEGTKDAAAPAAPTDTVADAAVTPPADAAPTDEPVFKEESPATDAPVAAAPMEPTEEKVAKNDEAPPAEPAALSAPAAPAVYAPLQKVKDAPFTKGEVSLNRVYLARPKDTTKSVAKKIYGKDRSKDLAKWNPILKRGMRVGDKVYYSSPNNPTDTKMLNYYEDVGAPAQTYVSKDGDNMRTVSKNLLGFKDAWKEVWATNPLVESKSNVPAGLEIKYWTDAPAAEPMTATKPLAKNSVPTGGQLDQLNDTPEGLPPEPPPASSASVGAGQPTSPTGQAMNKPPTELPPQAVATAVPTPPAAQAVAANDPLAPPPPVESSPAAAAAAGAVAGQDPLPPPSAPGAPTAAKSAASKPIKKVAPGEEGGTDPDTMMAIGFGGILLIAAAVLFVIIRRNRTKRMDLGQTQV